ncbi:hypothetical protein R3X27_19145 [Tropicimonas sp. TH_r6]|uniref:hypothetical protein n=1 Tax=Tropicimonas sp. TH_r6 TaxID=3082085 RepID=UPI002954CF24|nr:hypothetical protein [Tropicimonas sp. TH_r6]MDV7144802.1 hypothetical protein [Tropicimonas sp. TH_r6]
MTRQNRVLPTGEFTAHPARGLFMGNRGILHGATGQLGPARWRHRNWICCRLAFKGRKRTLMHPGRYTELFFLDEAVALAAGHRPCAECRRADYLSFRAAWQASLGPPGCAADLDRALHAARVTRNRRQVRHEAAARALPDGAIFLWKERPMLALGDAALPFTPDGYESARERPGGSVTVLTPAPTLAVLCAGFRPVLHPSAAP